MDNKKSAQGDFIDTNPAEAQKEQKELKEQNDKKYAKNAKKKNGKPGLFKRIGAKIKDVFSELKKVSWPTFPKVVKKTGVVIVVVLAFLVVITAFDYGLGQLLNLLYK